MMMEAFAEAEVPYAVRVAIENYIDTAIGELREELQAEIQFAVSRGGGNR